MLKIRLQRTGRRNQPHFRVVVCEHTSGPKSGKVVEQVGFRNPKTKEQKLDAERITYWISVGAQPSDTVHNILVEAGVIKGEKKNVLPHKAPVKKEEEEKAEEKKKDEGGEEAAEGDAPADEGGDDKPAEEAPAEEKAEDAPAEEEKEEGTPAEEPKEEKKEEKAPIEDKKEEKPAEEAPAEEEKKEE